VFWLFGRVTITTGEPKEQFRLTKFRGREADFSTSLLAKDASSFGRNDDSFRRGEKEQATATTKAWWPGSGLHPTHRKGAMDGATGRLW